MTIYIKFVDNEFAGAFRNIEAVDKNRMEYQTTAKAYCDSISSIIDYSIDSAKNKVKTFSDFFAKVKQGSSDYSLFENDIKEAQEDLEKYEVIKTDLEGLLTSLDYCKFYCKYHGIEYRLVKVYE